LEFTPAWRLKLQREAYHIAVEGDRTVHVRHELDDVAEFDRHFSTLTSPTLKRKNACDGSRAFEPHRISGGRFASAHASLPPTPDANENATGAQFDWMKYPRGVSRRSDCQ